MESQFWLLTIQSAAKVIWIIFKLGALPVICKKSQNFIYDSIYGACETFFKPDLNPEELEDVLG